MGGTTSTGIPYPTGTDRVADGDNAMQAIAEKVDYTRRASQAQNTTDLVGVVAVTPIPQLNLSITVQDATSTFMVFACPDLDVLGGGLVEMRLLVAGVAQQPVLLASSGRGVRSRQWMLTGLTAGAKTLSFDIRAISGSVTVYGVHSLSYVWQIR